MKIYLARHGETDWNAARRLQGWTDIRLNETGRRQARDLAKILSATRLDGIYCSALQRSMETAQILDRHPVIRMAELNEQSLGKYEGVTLSEEELQQFRKQRMDPTYTIEGGESRKDHLERTRQALQKIQSNHSEDSQVLIIGHGGTNNLILQELLKIETDLMFRIANHEIFLIDQPAAGDPTLWKYLTIP